MSRTFALNVTFKDTRVWDNVVIWSLGSIFVVNHFWCNTLIRINGDDNTQGFLWIDVCLPLLLSASLSLTWGRGEDFVSFCEDKRQSQPTFYCNCKPWLVLPLNFCKRAYLVASFGLACPLHDLIQTLGKEKINTWDREKWTRFSACLYILCIFWHRIWEANAQQWSRMSLLI